MKRFRPNRNAEAELRRERRFMPALRDAGENVKRHAEAMSPRGTSARGVATRFRVVEDGDRVRVINDDAFYHLVEFGSVNNAAYAPMRRGVRAAGLRLDEDPK